MRKPLGNKYVENLQTIAQHLLKRRMELGLTQKKAAKMIGVCEDTFRFWETGRVEPFITYYPKIIAFLGYVPFSINTNTLAGKIFSYRILNGLSQEALATKVGLDESTIVELEKGEQRPFKRTLEKLRHIVRL